MRIGFFTDTYFPQISGVSTSIETLKDELEKKGHEVYIFTTTDPDTDKKEKAIVRMPSIPFVSFKDRRIVVRGLWFAYQIAKELRLEIIHTHTEFGVGLLGVIVAKRLKVPVIHTYHTMYDEYLHYIAKGKLIRPTHVKYLVRIFINRTNGVVCPSQRVVDTLNSYEVNVPMRTIPTGIVIEGIRYSDTHNQMIQSLRKQLGLTDNQLMFLSVSRLSYEKNIQAIIEQFPKLLKTYSNVRLIIVGKGPYGKSLRDLAQRLKIQEYVYFVGEIPHDQIKNYYRAANYFVCASTSETQGLTYAESIASGTQCIVKSNEYVDRLLDDERLGTTFARDEDFSEITINYIRRSLTLDEEVKTKKLAEISAERFGAEIYGFYKQAIDSYHHTKCI